MAVAAGLLLGIALRIPAFAPFALAAAMLAAALLARRVVLRTLCLFLLGFVIGGWRIEQAETFPTSDVVNARFDGDRVEVRGRVIDADLDETGIGRIDLEIEDGILWTGRLRAQLRDPHPIAEVGSRIRIAGRLKSPRPQTNPGAFDYRDYLRRRGIGALLLVGRDDAIVELAPAPPGWNAVLLATRHELRRRLAAHATPEAAAFLSALLLGQREELPESFVTDLQRTGTAHFLAISGQNLVMLLQMAWLVLILLGFRATSLHLALLAFLFFYASMTGWSVSVARAFLMSAAVLAGALLWRRHDSISSLAASAIAILLIDPRQASDPGFQLSFLAVIGILAMTTRLVADLAPQHKTSKIDAMIRATVAVSMAAWLATAPAILIHFHLVTPIFLLANLVLLPVIAVEMGLGLAVIGTSWICPPLAGGLGWIASRLMEIEASTAAMLTSLPGSFAYAPAPGLWLTILYYMLLAGWMLGGRAWLRVGLLLPVVLTAPVFLATAPAAQETAILDVGRGSAQVVRLSDGRVIVIDCGSLSFRDVGSSTVAPFLWSRGITRIDLLILSHSDADHVNGAAGLLERFAVGAIAVPPGFRAAALIVEAQGRGIPVQEWRRVAAPARDIAVLGPAPGRPKSLNDGSLVVRVGNVLFPGDIQDGGVEALLQLGSLECSILVAPHHGKQFKLHRELIDAVAPDLVLVSSPEGYASAEVLDAFALRARVLTTGRDGAIIITEPPSR